MTAALLHAQIEKKEIVVAARSPAGAVRPLNHFVLPQACLLLQFVLAQFSAAAMSRQATALAPSE